MKTLLKTVAIAIVSAATLPAIAGPDWSIIEKGRKQARTGKSHTQDCMHQQRQAFYGPRAQVTPKLSKTKQLSGACQVAVGVVYDQAEK